MKCRVHILGLLLAQILFLTLSTVVYADDSNAGKIVRVGYIDYHGFIECDEDGNYTGYGVEYLNEIAKYTGFQYEYVYGTWDDLVRMLGNGEIDLLCNVQYTKERTEIFDYCAYPIGYTQGLLYTRKDNTELCYNDFRAFQNITVGILHDNAMTGLFHEFATKNKFTCYLQEFETDEQMLQALNRGEIDAMCTEHLANHTGLALLADFGADAYYLVSYPGNSIMEPINYALKQIKKDVDFEAELHHKYYDSSAAASTIQFTLEEKEYIKNTDQLVVGLMKDRSPLSYEDENGNAAGMTVELMNQVSKQCGIPFSYRFLDGGQTGYDFLSKGRGDLVAGLAVSDFSTLHPQLLQSNTFQNTSIVFVGRDGTDFSTGKSLIVALPEGFIHGTKVVSAKYPNFTFYYGTSTEDCLKAIRDGKADVMLQNLYIVRECLQSPLYDGLDIFPAFSFPEEEKVVTLQENSLLLSIINKCIQALPEDEINDIVINNTIAKTYHTSVGEIVYKYRFPLLGIAILLFILIVMLFLISIIKQRNYLAVEKVNEKLETANHQLEEAVIQADGANRAKSSFLSQMSHEIRTPMNAIVGLTEIARQHEDDHQKIDSCLNKIATSSRVLLNILNDVLDMSAIETGKLKIANDKFDLKQILNGISTIYYPQCKSKGVVFEMTIDVEQEILIGDSLRVSQILMNLVSNAYKFTAEGGSIHIDVKQREQRKDIIFLKFTVADTGCGMSRDMQERLFKPFEQETSGTARKFGGSGLGLSIAKNLVDMMHGVIKVESEQGKGTTFMVELPFQSCEHTEKENKDILKQFHILLIDDEPVSREYTATVLGRIGVPYDTAASKEAALQMLQTDAGEGKEYDVCIADWRILNRHYEELINGIRTQRQKKSCILIVSTYDVGEVQDDARAIEADYFINKPLFQSTLFDILMTLTRGGLKEESANPKTFDFTGHKVLLAEDQELNAEIAMELLSLVHMSADHADNGKTAIEMFEASLPGTYDVILMDVQMPEMDGYETTAAIRKLQRPDAQTIPIFAMTANAFTEDISAAISAGMNGHIAKPIDTKILYETLSNVIKQ